MKPLLFLFFAGLVSFTRSNGQSFERFVSELKNNLHSYSAAEKTINDFEHNTASYEVGTYDDRYNYFELMQKAVSIAYKYKSNTDSICQRYHLKLFGKDDRLLYMRLVLWYDSRDGRIYDKTLIDFRDSTSAIRAVDSFNKEHGTSYKWDEQFEETEYDHYGIAWGYRKVYNDEPYEPMERLFNLVIVNDMAGIRQLCYSLCDESKAYGATGLYLMKRTGKSFGEPDNNLFLWVRESCSKVNFASGGCLVWAGTPIADALSEEFLERVYKCFRDYLKDKK